MRQRSTHLICCHSLITCLVATAASAQADAWQFEATPYFLAAGLDGETGIRGVTADVDMPFSDIWDNLDAGFMALFTAQSGPWTLGFELVYFEISDEGSKSATGPFGKVNVDGALELTTEMDIVQATAAYRLVDQRTTVDLLGALRYTRLNVDTEVVIATTPGIIFPGGATRGSGSESWTDAVVGLHILHPLSEKWALMGYADVGAGGSDLTYQMMVGLNWRFSDALTAKIGYRHLYQDYENGGIVWDMVAAGAYLGLGIRF